MQRRIYGHTGPLMENVDTKLSLSDESDEIKRLAGSRRAESASEGRSQLLVFFSKKNLITTIVIPLSSSLKEKVQFIHYKERFSFGFALILIIFDHFWIIHFERSDF